MRVCMQYRTLDSSVWEAALNADGPKPKVIMHVAISMLHATLVAFNGLLYSKGTVWWGWKPVLSLKMWQALKSRYSVTLLHAVSVPNCFEFIALEFQLSLSSNYCIVVICVYRPHSAVTSILIDLAYMLSSYVNREVIVMGDFNIDWLSDASESIKEICSNLNLTINNRAHKTKSKENSQINFNLFNRIK